MDNIVNEEGLAYHDSDDASEGLPTDYQEQVRAVIEKLCPEENPTLSIPLINERGQVPDGEPADGSGLAEAENEERD